MNVKKKCYHNIYKEKNKMRFFLVTANVEEIKKANDMGAVSYTHLDVYKRQPFI